MKVLYFGGQKSGKSRLAEAKALQLSQNKKPYYLATYDNSYADEEMRERLKKHQQQRANSFITIEEPLNLTKPIQEGETYLVDCLSMWILNTLDMPIERLFEQLDALKSRDANIIFVLNDVNGGVIPIDKESRKFVDRTGEVGQRVAHFCDEVYEVKLGIKRGLK